MSAVCLHLCKLDIGHDTISTFTMGDTVEDQQVGCLWSGEFLISVSLSGYINYLDPRTPSKPVKVICGHNKPITKMVKGHDDSNPTLITSGSDGRVVEWTVADGSTKVIQGRFAHTLVVSDRTFPVPKNGLRIFLLFEEARGSERSEHPSTLSLQKNQSQRARSAPIIIDRF